MVLTMKNVRIILRDFKIAKFPTVFEIGNREKLRDNFFFIIANKYD